ncbi:MAG: guanylate kinase [Bacteroidetes bacterium]|nr:guanylate kinase [Bacteroidota bacterium]
MAGKLIILSAPSGSGKTSIVRQVLQAGLHIEFSVSSCSRPPRLNEVNGKDYYFLSPAEFREKINHNEFIEWEEVYPGQYYGTMKSEVTRIWNNGNHVIFDVDVIGGLNIKNLYKEQAISIFIMPPSISILEERLRHRNSESEDSLRKRLKKADYEMTFADRFDKIIINDDLPIAVDKTILLIKEFIQDNAS